jgi:hypothetical protein
MFWVKTKPKQLERFKDQIGSKYFFLRDESHRDKFSQDQTLRQPPANKNGQLERRYHGV